MAACEGWIADPVVVPSGILGDGAMDDGVSYGLADILVANVNPKTINYIQSNPLTVYGIYSHCDIAS